VTWTDEISVRRVRLDEPFEIRDAAFVCVQWAAGGELCQCLADVRLPSAWAAMPDPGSTASWAELSGLERFVKRFKPPINRPTMPADPLPLALRLRALRAEVLSQTPEQEEWVRLTASLLIMEWLRQSLPGAPCACPAEKRIELAVHQMLADYSHPWNVGELSDMIRVSPSYFSQLCRKRFGKSPIDMLIERRIDVARRLLRVPGETVKGVSRAVGFSDIYYFSRLFKSRCGVSPTQFMNMSENHGRSETPFA
jgi:AraC-like DNA-binding protein